MTRESKIQFFWTDDEQLLSSDLKFKCKYQYERNWESIHSKYEQMHEIIVESYPKADEKSKDFPNLKNFNL